MREEQNKKTSQKVIKMLRKRWVVPAIYLVSAAVILTGALWYQYSNAPTPTKTGTTVDTTREPDAIPASQPEEKLTYPVSKDVTVQVKSHYYDDSASKDEQQASLIQTDSNTFTINTGMDLVDKSGKEFDVTAALSGTVTKAQKDAELGYVVVVESGNGLVSYYQSLKSVSVDPGTKVSQGQVLGTAGTALIGKENGIHVHYELRKDGVAINPEKYQGQEVSSIISSVNTKSETKESNTMNTSGSVSDDNEEDSSNSDTDGNKIQQ
ncbi:M23 family metallopeptidase [Bacillus sp. AFS041924]|uniref:M23 family metallopeptidase n=1 Tax=Bacillus sp. AFS041924 TaxID=2033503 RepID=UPI00159B8AFB|nr:M23 family metallopeptidase [Bacillus sp. AFS041924]